MSFLEDFCDSSTDIDVVREKMAEEIASQLIKYVKELETTMSDDEDTMKKVFTQAKIFGESYAESIITEELLSLYSTMREVLNE
jgi:hypothetical protein